jgi:hypothetical protein
LSSYKSEFSNSSTFILAVVVVVDISHLLPSSASSSDSNRVRARLF